GLDIEYRIVRPDGECRWVRVRSFQVRDGAEKLIRHIGIVTDITGQKQSETELAEAHRKLLVTSREAGMAEVATGVLHNVGNVLNSVNLGATGIRERLEASRFSHLRKVTDLIEQHRDDLPEFLTAHRQGRTIPAFLSKLTRHLEDEDGQMREQMDTLQEHIDHIKQIVSMQQSYARVFGVMELVQPEAL